MYQVEASRALLRPRTWATSAARLSVPRNVVMLGTVSRLTDVSAEMVATALPLYLVFSLGLQSAVHVFAAALTAILAIAAPLPMRVQREQAA